MNDDPLDAARMERSAAVLKEEGVPYNPHLPPVTESEAKLKTPDQICDVSAMGEIIWRQESLKRFLDGTKPRTRDEIMDAADLALRYDWACVDARIEQQEPPAYLNDEVVVERHYAFNWLIGAYGDAGWDDVSTDT